MTDDNIIAPSNGKEDKATEPVSENWKALVGDKFKTEADLAKAYKDLEKKLGETSDEVKKTREFAEVINPLLEEIRSDPEIFNKLDERLRKRNSPPTPDNSDNAKTEKTIDQEEMRSVASDLVLSRFEERHGINKLSSDEQKKIRQSIGDAIFENTGTRFDAVDLRRLNTVLENAYVLAVNKSDKSTLEAIKSAQEEGSISSIPSSPGKAENTLTPEQNKIADKLGLTREQYLEGMKTPTKSS